MVKNSKVGYLKVRTRCLAISVEVESELGNLKERLSRDTLNARQFHLPDRRRYLLYF